MERGFQELSHFEAEYFIKCISKFTLNDLWTDKFVIFFIWIVFRWIESVSQLETLNNQAHVQATMSTDEFIVDLLASHEKVSVLISNLVMLESFREYVMPHMMEVASKYDIPSFLIILPIRMECVTMNLLECILFHQSATETADEALIDLIGYVYRRLVHLIETSRNNLTSLPPKSAEEALNYTLKQQTLDSIKDSHFSCCISAIGAAQCLSEHSNKLSVSVAASLTCVFDFPLVLVPLLEAQPWWRKTPAGHLERYDLQQWRRVVSSGKDTASSGINPTDMTLSKAEGQVFMAMFNFCMKSALRDRYELTSFRADNLLKLRRYLTEPIKDQIPPLADLHRALEEMAVTGQFTGTSKQMPILLEVVPHIRDAIIREYGSKWATVAALAEERLEQCAKDKDSWIKIGMKMCDVPEVLLRQEVPECIVCGETATSRCSLCQEDEWYCGRDCQTKAWKVHKKVCKGRKKQQSDEIKKTDCKEEYTEVNSLLCKTEEKFGKKNTQENIKIKEIFEEDKDENKFASSSVLLTEMD